MKKTRLNKQELMTLVKIQERIDAFRRKVDEDMEISQTEEYIHTDDDDIKDTLKFWRANLRRAKRYWSMNTETLDKIQDGEIEDTEEE